MSRRTLKGLATAAALAGTAAALAAGVVLAGHESDRAVMVSPERAAAGPPAPELSGTDPITGKQVRLSDFDGKPVVVNVWASWCPGCNEEAVALGRFAERHPEAVVLGIDLEDTVAEAKRFYARWGWEHPSIFDPRGDLAARLGLRGLPETIFLDAEHRIVTRIVGAAELAGFEEGLEQAKRAS